MENNILILGSGGHCLSVLDTILSLDTYTKIGIIVEDGEELRIGESVLGVPIVGTDKMLSALYKEGYTKAFIGLGSIGNANIRKNIYRNLKEIGFLLPNIIDLTSVIGLNVSLTEGIYVGKRSVINVNSTIGACAIINTGTIVEHECKIGAFAHISPGAVVCGNVIIEDEVHIGANSVVIQNITIEEKSLIGAGSTVIHSIKSNKVAVGNPCRVIKDR